MLLTFFFSIVLMDCSPELSALKITTFGERLDLDENSFIMSVFTVSETSLSRQFVCLVSCQVPTSD